MRWPPAAAKISYDIFPAQPCLVKKTDIKKPASLEHHRRLKKYLNQTLFIHRKLSYKNSHFREVQSIPKSTPTNNRLKESHTRYNACIYWETVRKSLAKVHHTMIFFVRI
ncbi:MAG: hypothetical protein IMY82_03890 [Chloroflexi bacterium]|nr:hypothetical protein [Chloroflexota bacterium]